MDPPLKKKYRTVKVKKFINSWLDEYIDGVKTSTWLRPDPEHIDRALCLVCPAPCSFSINGGFKVVRQHCQGKRHQEFLIKSQNDPKFRRIDNSSPSILV